MMLCGKIAVIAKCNLQVSSGIHVGIVESCLAVTGGGGDGECMQCRV